MMKQICSVFVCFIFAWHIQTINTSHKQYITFEGLESTILSKPLDVAKKAIAQSTCINLPTVWGMRPIDWAVMRKNEYEAFELVQALIDKKCTIFFPEDNAYRFPRRTGGSPVCKAVQLGRYDMVKLLLENGANPNEVAVGITEIKKGRLIQPSALHLAIKHHDTPMVELFMDHGADPYNRSCYGHNAMDCAARSGTPEIIYLLAKYNVDPNASDLHGYFPIDKTKNTKKINALLLIGARPPLPTTRKRTFAHSIHLFERREKEKFLKLIALQTATTQFMKKAKPAAPYAFLFCCKHSPLWKNLPAEIQVMIVRYTKETDWQSRAMFAHYMRNATAITQILKSADPKTEKKYIHGVLTESSRYMVELLPIGRACFMKQHLQDIFQYTIATDPYVPENNDLREQMMLDFIHTTLKKEKQHETKTTRNSSDPNFSAPSNQPPEKIEYRRNTT